MKKKKIFQLTFSILFSTLLVVGLVYASWTAPTQNPPNGNVKAPINVSDTAQSKLGDFGLGGGVGQPLYWLKNIGGTLYFSSTNPAGDRIVIGQDGKVGIGAPGPAEKLEVDGAIKIGTTFNTNAGTIRWTGTDFEGYTGSNWVSLTSGGGGLWTDQGAYIYPNNYNQFVIEDTGNVGIGTTGPEERLHIGGTKGATFHDGGNKALSWNAYYNAGWKYIGDDFATQIYTSYNKDKLYIRTAPSGTAGNAISWNDGITINSNGNVGIGTTGLNNRLEVAGDIGLGTFSTATGQPRAVYVYGYKGTGAQYGIHLGYANNRWRTRIFAPTGRDISFAFHSSALTNPTQTDWSEKMVIQDNGKVGIGTTNPAEDLHVYRGDSDVARIYATGANQGSGMIYVGQSTSYGGGLAYDGDGNPDIVGGTDRITFFRRNAGTDYEVMSYRYSDNNVYFAGNVGIGTMSPQGRLHIKAAGSKVIIEI